MNNSMSYFTEYIKKIIVSILRFEARIVLRRFRPCVIGITGSVGKTSTKEAIFTLLKEYYPTARSPKSYNSEVGVPLAVLGLESAWNSPLGWVMNVLKGAWRAISRAPYPEYLVLEMGVDRPGDFDDLLAWVHPEISVVTAIGEVPVHVEFFSSPEHVAKEKQKLVQSLDEKGYAILNADDPLTFEMKEKSRGKVITYGFGKSAFVRASGYKMLIRAGLPYGMTFKVDYDGKTVPIKVEGIVGEQNVYSLLAAACVGLVKGLNLIEISEALAKYRPPHGRLNMIEGLKNTLLIDDTYNASPLATSAALHVLGSVPERRKVAILGDMLELGKFTSEEHRKIGEIASEVADVVIAVGVRAKFIENKDIKSFHWFKNAEEASRAVYDLIEEEDVVLIKGSQGMRMEKITEALMRDPDEAMERLVRQDDYWKKRKIMVQ